MFELERLDGTLCGPNAEYFYEIQLSERELELICCLGLQKS